MIENTNASTVVPNNIDNDDNVLQSGNFKIHF